MVLGRPFLYRVLIVLPHVFFAGFGFERERTSGLWPPAPPPRPRRRGQSMPFWGLGEHVFFFGLFCFVGHRITCGVCVVCRSFCCESSCCFCESIGLVWLDLKPLFWLGANEKLPPNFQTKPNRSFGKKIIFQRPMFQSRTGRGVFFFFFFRVPLEPREMSCLRVSIADGSKRQRGPVGFQEKRFREVRTPFRGLFASEAF